MGKKTMDSLLHLLERSMNQSVMMSLMKFWPTARKKRISKMMRKSQVRGNASLLRVLYRNDLQVNFCIPFFLIYILDHDILKD